MDDTTSASRDGYGVLQLTVKVTTIRDNDNFTTRLAENSFDDKSIVVPTEGDVKNGEGGVIW